jgi:hypothetical protein
VGRVEINVGNEECHRIVGLDVLSRAFIAVTTSADLVIKGTIYSTASVRLPKDKKLLVLFRSINRGKMFCHSSVWLTSVQGCGCGGEGIMIVSFVDTKSL